MKNIVLSLVFLFVVSLGIQAQSVEKKNVKAATTTTTAKVNKAKKAAVKTGKKSEKKSCCDEGTEKNCPDSK